ncbi:hypothetical protein GZL_04680 [Streptomyces sp. 769]|nr:hypothetical protein GZL_04680 [Streptomyces sp. 769]
MPETSLTHAADSRCGSGSSRLDRSEALPSRVVHRARFEAHSPVDIRGRSSRPCGNRGQLPLRRSAPIFCPPRLWVAAVDKRAQLWTTRSSAHPMHRAGALLPSAIPSFTHVPHSPTHHLGVTAFTRRGEGWCRVAEQWTAVWRSRRSLGTTAPNLWVAGGQVITTPVDELSVHSLWIAVGHKSTRG